MAKKDSEDLPEVVRSAPLVEEPPVVARVVVEIRSDGSRTIARGAMEDLTTGQRAQIEAHGTSPLQLAFALAKSLRTLPGMTVRKLLGRAKR